jgi:hypothetical protein
MDKLIIYTPSNPYLQIKSVVELNHDKNYLLFKWNHTN